MSTGIDPCWSWLCDIRNPGVDSLIKVEFDQSHCNVCKCLYIVLFAFRVWLFVMILIHFQFTFNSYGAEDDDYDGYDYSLCGHLSAVRIVFLYRFVQEVSSLRSINVEVHSRYSKVAAPFHTSVSM